MNHDEEAKKVARTIIPLLTKGVPGTTNMAALQAKGAALHRVMQSNSIAVTADDGLVYTFYEREVRIGQTGSEAEYQFTLRVACEARGLDLVLHEGTYYLR